MALAGAFLLLKFPCYSISMSKTSVFSERYKNLNKEQKMAVDTIEGPVLVVAGPGTGKTTILTLRVARILEKTHTPPSGILAITYTNAGVKAMREKLREVIGNTAHDVYIHTFHSFASAMISEYPDHFISVNDFKQMTEVEAESMIRNIISDKKFSSLRPIGRPNAYVNSILRTISDVKKDALTPEEVRKEAIRKIKELKSDKDNLSTRGKSEGQLKATVLDEIDKLEKTLIFAGIYQKYEEEKRELKYRDYDDLIIELLVALKNDELLLRLIQERFQYILIDEHQDTNDSQNYIISLIAEFFKTPNIFVVGDEKQAIYRFQGASVENFLRFQKLWPKMKVISLSKNYRSHQSILDASFSMIENNYTGDEHKNLRVELKSESGLVDKPIDVISAENTLAMEEHLVKEIKKIVEKDKNATITIIVRRNRELEKVLRLLESNHIPVSSERSVDIFHHPLGDVFFELLQYLSDNSRTDALARTVVLGMWNLSLSKSLELSRSLNTGNFTDIEKILPQLIRIRKLLLSDGPVGAIIHIAEESGFTSLVSKNPQYIHVWRGIVTLAESITRDSEVTDPSKLIKMMLEYRESAEMKPVKISVGAPDLQVKAMTAHGSKGLEFDYVFIPYANDEAWVGKVFGSSFSVSNKNSSSHNVADIRRLFYVAITRAKKHVSILYALEESDGKALAPLRFISELHSKRVKETSLPRVDLNVDKESELFSDVGLYESFLVDQAKKTLMENGLSVTALNHFMECPNKFLYESILRFPQAPEIPSEKGSSLHRGISAVWFLKDRSLKDIERTMLKGALDYLETPLLSLKDKELLKSEIKEVVPLISKALLEHFSFSGLVYPEKWVEVPFAAKQTHINLHGKLDVILEKGERVSVFDYKSRRAMSVAAIKGETKNDDGNYFRQLVFYKLLLSGDFKWRDKKIETSLVFISPDDYGKCPIITLPIEDKDLKILREEVQDLINYVWSGKIGKVKCKDKDCKYCGYRELLD